MQTFITIARKCVYMSEKEAKDRLKKGWVHILVTFEIIGKPASHVDSSLRTFLDTIKKEDRVYWLEEHVEPAIKNDKDDYCSAFAEVDLLVKNLETATWLAMNYTPASIEIIEPTEFEMPALDIQNWINDLLSNLHNISISYKKQTSEMEFLRHNLTQLIHNTILLSLGRSAKKMPEIAKDTSLTKDTLEPQLKKLVNDGKVKEQKGIYSLA
jgi:hypothetical protein